MIAAVVAGAITLASATSTGPPAGLAGVPAGPDIGAESTCVQCHNSYPLNPDDQGKVQLLKVPETYAPGERYELTFEVSHPGAMRWGFQVTSVAKTTLKGAGDFHPVDEDTSTMRVAAGGRVYIEHGPAGRAATGVGMTGSYRWTFVWVAPERAAGEIQFYGMGVAANMDGSQGGDRIYAPSDGPLAITIPAEAAY